MKTIDCQGPVRMCAACGRRAPQRELLRLGLSDGGVTTDPSRRLPGRGAYICRRQSCAETLVRTRSLGKRLFRQPLDDKAWTGFKVQLTDKALFEPGEDSRGF